MTSPKGSPCRLVRRMETTSPLSATSQSKTGVAASGRLEVLKSPHQVSPNLSPRRQGFKRDMAEYSDEIDPSALLHPHNQREALPKSKLRFASPKQANSSSTSGSVLSPCLSSSAGSMRVAPKCYHSQSRLGIKTEPSSTRSKSVLLIPRLLFAMTIFLFGGVITFYEQFYIEGAYNGYSAMDASAKYAFPLVRQQSRYPVNTEQQQIFDVLEQGPFPEAETEDMAMNPSVEEKDVTATLCGKHSSELKALAMASNKTFLAVDPFHKATFQESMSALHSALQLAYLAGMAVVVPMELSTKFSSPANGGRKLLQDASQAGSSSAFSDILAESNKGAMFLGEKRSGRSRVSKKKSTMSSSAPKRSTFDLDDCMERAACQFETLVVAEEPEETKVQAMDLFLEENESDLEHFLTAVHARARAGKKYTFRLTYDQLDNAMQFHLNKPNTQKFLSATKFLVGDSRTVLFSADVENQGLSSHDKTSSSPHGKRKGKKSKFSKRKGKDGRKTLPRFDGVDTVLIEDGESEDFVYLDEESDLWPRSGDSIATGKTQQSLISISSFGRALKSFGLEMAANDSEA